MKTQETVQTLPIVGNLVGTWRRFGPVGPVYEITHAGPPQPDGNQMMRVRVVETGEELEYPLSAILEDPREH